MLLSEDIEKTVRSMRHVRKHDLCSPEKQAQSTELAVVTRLTPENTMPWLGPHPQGATILEPIVKPFPRMKKGPGQEKARAKNDVNRDAVDRYI